jgi:TM2 domain-containing membrane protein YozV
MSTYPYPNAESIFYQQYNATRRDELLGVLLALFLGGFGVHHFYLRRTGLGVLYLVFCWTPLPWFLGFIECFFMPGRVREFNAVQAAAIAAALGIYPPQPWAAPFDASVAQPTGMVPVSTLVACPHCNTTNASGSRFCSSCGTSLS